MRVDRLVLGDRSYPALLYLAAPDDSTKRVVHEVAAESTTEELLNGSKPKTEFKSSWLACWDNQREPSLHFAGRKLPRYVRYYGSHLRVFPHKLIKKFCETYLKERHRSDVFPTTNA